MVLFLLTLPLVSCSGNFSGTGFITSDGTVTYVPNVHDPSGDCWIVYNESLNETGWYIVNVEGRPKLDGRLMGRCVGYLEGFLIHRPLLDALNLFKDQEGIDRSIPLDPDRLAWYEKHLRWLNQSLDAYLDVPYWRQLSVIKSIFDGLFAGYNAASSHPLGYTELFAYVAQGDTEDLGDVLQYVTPPAGDRCTAVMRLSKDARDVFFAHNTWTSYRYLHSVIKHYNLPCAEFSSPRVTLSSILGLLSSVDDFYITGAGLLIYETSIGIENMSLFHDYLTPKSVTNWMRTLLAAFTSTNVIEWEDKFMLHNSGTYNNEYYVLDSKLLRGNQRVDKNLVHYVLQIPGPFRFIDDLTDELYREGFIASFNAIKNEAGVNITQYYLRVGTGPRGCLYHTCPRYLITKREARRLTDFELFKQFMRYSNYKRDQYGLYNGVPNHANTICARDDTDDDLSKRRLHGGLNAKACKASEALTRMQIYAVNSPSVDPFGPLNWSNYPMYQYSHDGLPEIWDFKWIETRNSGYEYCEKNRDEAECKNVNFCGWCGRTGKCLPGDFNGPYFGANCRAGWVSLETTVTSWMYIVFPILGVLVVAGVVVALVIWRKRRI